MQRNGKDALFSQVHIGANIGTNVEHLCEVLKRDSDPGRQLLIQVLLEIHQSKPLKVNMKELVDLETRRKIDQIRRFFIIELRLTKESMGKPTKALDRSGSHAIINGEFWNCL